MKTLAVYLSSSPKLHRTALLQALLALTSFDSLDF